MKNLSLFSAGILLSSFSFAQASVQNDLAADNIKGNVQHITDKYYQVWQDKNGKDSVGQQWESTDRNHETEYNAAGNIVWADFYKTGSTLNYRYTYKYDAAGNRIEETWFDSDNALDYRLTRKFSNKGYLMELKKFVDTNAVYIEKTIYEPDP